MKFKALSCCIALLLLAGSAFAQWNLEYQQELTTAFYAVDFPSSTVGYMVGSGGAIYKTTDGGDTWVEQTSPTTLTFYDCFFKSETEGWAVGDNGLIAVTTDGTNWALHDSSGVMTTADINTVFFVGNNGWLGTDGSGVYLTTNNGADWTVPTTNVATDDVNEISFSDALNGYAAIDGAGIMYTTDGGDNWTLSAMNLGPYPYTRTDIEAIRAVDGTYGIASGWGSYIGLQPTIILVTSDGGASWATPDGTYPWATYAYGFGITTFDDGHAMITGGYTGCAAPVLHAAPNYGTWSTSEAFFGDDLRDIAAVPGTNRVVAVGDEGCVALSTDKGQTWSFSYLPSPGSSGVLAFTHIGKDKIIGVGDSGMMFKGDLTKDPVTWELQLIAPEQFAPNLHDVAFVNGVLYVSGSNGYLCKSTDLGETWTQLEHYPDNNHGIYSMHWFDDQNGVLCGEWGSTSNDDAVFTTTDGGETLNLVWNNVLGVQFNTIAFAPGNPLVGVVAGDNNHFVYTTDGGTNWTPGTEDIADGADDLEEVHMTSALVGWAVGDDGTVCKTTDGGVNWTMLAPWTGLDLMDVYFSQPNFGWIVGYDGYALYTDDGGASWNDISEPTLGSNDINSVYFHSPGGKLWIGVDYGIMMTRSDYATGDETPIALPFKLEQNFPNPFNPSTRIKFSLRREGRVTLNIYDVSGRLVAKVLDRDLPAGDHEVGFQADGLVSGVYFYRLAAGDEVMTKKMILLR